METCVVARRLIGLNLHDTRSASCLVWHILDEVRMCAKKFKNLGYKTQESLTISSEGLDTVCKEPQNVI